MILALVLLVCLCIPILRPIAGVIIIYLALINTPTQVLWTLGAALPIVGALVFIIPWIVRKP